MESSKVAKNVLNFGILENAFSKSIVQLMDSIDFNDDGWTFN